MPGEENAFPAFPTDDAASLYDKLPENEQNEWAEHTATDFLQYNGRYIVTSLSSGLALIDQHRAHIRILYERYMRQLKEHKAPSQRLLFPEMVNVSPTEGVMLEHIMPQLQEVGFDISPLGGGSFSLLGTPMGTEGIAPTVLLSSILADAVSGQADAADTVGHIIALAMARKVALPVGQVLNNEEMLAIVEQLFACSSPAITPDGAAVLTTLKPEKMF